MASRGPISNKILHPSIYASILQKRSSNIEFFKTLNYHNLKFKKLNLTIISKFFSFFFATSLKNSDFLCWQKRQCKFKTVTYIGKMFFYFVPQLNMIFDCARHWHKIFFILILFTKEWKCTYYWLCREKDIS